MKNKTKIKNNNLLIYFIFVFGFVVSFLIFRNVEPGTEDMEAALFFSFFTFASAFLILKFMKVKYIDFQESKIIICESKIDVVEFCKKDIKSVEHIKHYMKDEYGNSSFALYIEIKLKNGSCIEYDYKKFNYSSEKAILKNFENLGFDMQPKVREEFFENILFQKKGGA